MKEANHRAPLSKVCLPDWGVFGSISLVPLSPSRAHPTASPPPSHSLTSPEELPPQSIIADSERSCTAPPLYQPPR
ncbi:hypothetical protein PBY51_006092 [Eleginops maclovinus]|uniref:Uncharacterized protein n=1 Tax=Eleginops maclovinus TaxID=56733 RepID=A0AAN7WTB1_ELEMC|nr:hypothetical protein PBY51_006092 [Eleginops maclovinus]